MAGREMETRGTQLHVLLTSGHVCKYGGTPLIRINCDGELSSYAENPDHWIFFLKIGYIGSLKLKKILQMASLGYLFIYLFIYLQITH